jgi:5-formyltetrahydrofolate cyclo-ligase
MARLRRTDAARAVPDFARSIASHAGALPLRAGMPVASYYPIADEADPRLLGRALSALGHAILLPRVTATGAPLVFHLWREHEPLRPNRFAVPEPLAEAKEIHPGLLLVPLLAFDAAGTRLGYGGGFYDRTIARLRAAGGVDVIGIAYDGQEFPELPRDRHDQPLDGVLTESGLRQFPPREETGGCNP